MDARIGDGIGQQVVLDAVLATLLMELPSCSKALRENLMDLADSQRKHVRQLGVAGNEMFEARIANAIRFIDVAESPDEPAA